MTDQSALIGHPPISHEDRLIMRGLRIVAPSEINPNASIPFGPLPPAGSAFQQRSTSLIIGEAFGIFFVLLFKISRLLVRRFYKCTFGADDWMMIPGALGCVAYLLMNIAAETAGCLGKHIWECTYTEIDWYVKISMIEEPLFYFSVFSIKLSIALGNQRLTKMTFSRAWNIFHWAFISIFLCLLPLCTILNMFQYLPVPAGYSLKYVGAMANPHDIRCLDRRAISLSTRILHMVSDIALLCVPIVIIAQLHMPKAKKYRVSSVFAIGGMSTIASIVRNVLVFKPMEDFTWQSYPVYCFDIIDVTFAAIVACLPALNSLLEALIRRLGLTTQPGSSNIRSFSWMKGNSPVIEQHSSPSDRLGLIAMAEQDTISETSQQSRVDTSRAGGIQLVAIDNRFERNW